MGDVAAQEKRAIRRFALQLPVTVTAASGEQLQATAQTRDVSSHGICFDCDAAMEKGSAIEFTLTLPAEVTMTEPIRVRCRGTVVRVESKEAGKFSIAAAIENYEFVANDEAQISGAGTDAPPIP
jgi:PilZ domain